MNEHGEKYSISSRCAEMDRELVSLLGVSKPVLDNVIFCHQEDSNWPLCEGKALKQKFDDIFASTRYVKALEVIRVTKKDQATTIKSCSTEINYLVVNKNQAAEMQEELEDREGRYLASKESVDSVRQKLQPIEDQLEMIGSKASEIHTLRMHIQRLTVEKKEMEKNVMELERNISTKFSGSMEELQRTIKEFQAKLKEKKEDLELFTNKLENVEVKKSKLGKERSKLLVEQGKIQQELERIDQIKAKRNKFVQKYAEHYQLDGFSGEVTESNASEFLSALEEKAKAILRESNEEKSKFEAKEKEFNAEKDEKTNKKTKLETEKSMKSSQMKSSAEEVRGINKKLSEVEASAGRLSDLSAELKRAENELSDVEGSLNVEAIKEEIKQLNDRKSEQDGALKVLDAEISKLSRESSVRSELEVHKKEKTTKEDQIQRLRAKNEDSLRHLLGKMPEQGLSKALNAFIVKHSQTVKEKSNKKEQLGRKLARLEVERKNQMEQLKRKEDEQKEYSQKIFETCSSQDLNETMEAEQNEMENQQKAMAYVKGTEHVYNRFLDKMEKSHDRCPLCQQNFKSEADAEELITSMENKLSLVPSRVRDIETKLDKHKKKYEDMLQLRPIKAALMDIEKEDLPNLQARISALNKQIENTTTEISDLEDLLETGLSDEAQANSMVADMSMIDRYTNELKDVARKISSLSSKLSGDGGGKSMQEVTREREDIQLQLENVMRNMERKRNKLDEHVEHLQRLRSSVNELGREKLHIEKDLQERSQLEKQKEELQENIEALKIEIQECSVQLHPLQAEIAKIQEELESVINEKEEQVQKARDSFNKIKTRGKEVGQLGQEIRHFEESGKDEELEEMDRNLKKIKSKLDDLETEKEELAANVDAIRKDLASQQVKERELQDNFTIKKKEKDIKAKVQELETEEEKLGGIDANNLAKEERKLRKQQEELTKEKHTAQGRLQSLEDEIKTMRKNLKADQFVDAEKKYMDKKIELRTTELASEDLDKYYKALDRAVMTYHESKMREINKIIRELWTKTYKGNDIETIEIRSDDDGVVTATKRRVYHYRVVMIKGDTALDMRGRCSAGQKVLASLIIRLALAETFCINCGILALDEPTTNLDRENIESLAFALVEIITSRRKQRNFQLVIITHDEDFVELLGRSDYVEEFFKVRKNEVGCSLLVKARVADLHTR